MVENANASEKPSGCIQAFRGAPDHSMVWGHVPPEKFEI